LEKPPFKIVLNLGFPLVLYLVGHPRWVNKTRTIWEWKLRWAVGTPSSTPTTATGAPSWSSPHGYPDGIDYQKEIYSLVAWLMPDARG